MFDYWQVNHQRAKGQKRTAPEETQRSLCIALRYHWHLESEFLQCLQFPPVQ